jgi:hypothetical protein
MVMQQVFISYAPQDKVRAEQIYIYLERAELHPWYDVHLKSGEDWKSQIDAALHQSSHCVVLLSHASIKSPVVATEYRHFISQNKPVVVALIDDVSLEDIPERLKTSRIINLRTATHTTIAELINALQINTPLLVDALPQTDKKPLKLTLNLNINEFGNDKFRDLVAKLNDIGVEEIEVVNVDKAS